MVRELVADTMTVEQMRGELQRLLHDPKRKKELRDGYGEMARRLGEPGAPMRAARQMVELLREAGH